MQNLKNSSIIFVFILLLLNSCNFNSTYLNREEDKNDAEKIANQYYNFIKAKNYEATYGLFNNEFWKVTSKEKLKELFIATQNKLGGLDTITLDHWETKIVKGTNPSSEYVLYYLNKYQKYTAKETLRLIKNESDKIQIIAFNVNSEGFMK